MQLAEAITRLDNLARWLETQFRREQGQAAQDMWNDAQAIRVVLREVAK